MLSKLRMKTVWIILPSISGCFTMTQHMNVWARLFYSFNLLPMLMYVVLFPDLLSLDYIFMLDFTLYRAAQACKVWRAAQACKVWNGFLECRIWNCVYLCNIQPKEKKVLVTFYSIFKIFLFILLWYFSFFMYLRF